MFEELDDLLLQEVTDDAWYDDGFIIAQDIMNDFGESDWQELLDRISQRSVDWQKKLVYAIDNQMITEEILVIDRILQSANDDELFDMCIDALRLYDVQKVKKHMNTYNLVKMITEKKQNKSNLVVKVYDDFISKL